MTGLPLISTTVTPNFNLRSQVSAWLATAAAEENDAATAPATATSPNANANASSSSSRDANEIGFVVRLMWNPVHEVGSLQFVSGGVESPSASATRASSGEVKGEMDGDGGGQLKDLRLILPSTHTVAELRRIILLHTNGTFHTQGIVIQGRNCKGHLTLAQARIGNSVVLAQQQNNGGAVVRVVVSRGGGIDTDTNPIQLIVSRSFNVNNLMWQLWRDFPSICSGPASSQCFTDISSAGDGGTEGTILSGKTKVSHHAKVVTGDECEVLSVSIFCHRSANKLKYTSRHMTRLQAVQQLFHAYTNRTEGYALHNRLGKAFCNLTFICHILIYHIQLIHLIY
jgi:hypothetical protein